MAKLKDQVKGKSNDSNYISVQDYTGQGYELPGGKANDKIAKAHKDEIDKAVKKFFLDKYKTEVKVHSIVGNKDGATVFVESIGEPHFHTYVIVPIDAGNKKVLADEVWAQEGAVEGAIESGLYQMINKSAFDNLDQYFKELVSNYPVVGETKKSIERTGATGYMTPYYYINIFDRKMDVVYNYYKDHPQADATQLKSVFENYNIDPEKIFITIQLYMKDPEAQPSKKIFNTICDQIRNNKKLPKGLYRVVLHDNRIGKKSGSGNKDNSLILHNKDKILIK
ncbi:DUF1672 family protein [Camelliibacillus cellulosilyticus]|uniref:DUF1672 family protein n=1 Tax=Camelliibacillus cellulosilyticus TaxID=2174486 RepID=A0ABV9GNR1_9BACL